MPKKLIFLLTLFLITIIFITSCKTDEAKPLKLKTSDSIGIAADFYPSNSDKGVILLHMLSSDKSAWQPFAKELQSRNYNVVAIDMRGHGESDLDIKAFTEKDFNDMILDAEAAYKHLKARKIASVSTIGASIGANIALNHAAKNKEIKTVILLSPGLDYRRVLTESSINNYSSKPLFLAASEEDAYSFESSQALFDGQAGKGTVKFKRLINAGHGTAMLSNTDLKKEILDWLDDYNN